MGSDESVTQDHAREASSNLIQDSKGIAQMRIEARVWLEFVRLSTGFGYQRLVRAFSKGALGRKLSVDEVRKLSVTWKRYAAGTRSPSADTVNRVEARVPGAKKWLQLALWDALSPAALGMDDLRKILEGLRPEVRQVVFRDNSGFRLPDLRNASRRRLFNRARADSLGQMGRHALCQSPPDIELYFDALCCGIVLMREGRLLDDDERHSYAHRVLNWLWRGLEAIPETAPYVECIMQRIGVVAGEAIYVLEWPDDAEIQSILLTERKEPVEEAEIDCDPFEEQTD